MLSKLTRLFLFLSVTFPMLGHGAVYSTFSADKQKQLACTIADSMKARQQKTGISYDDQMKIITQRLQVMEKKYDSVLTLNQYFLGRLQLGFSNIDYLIDLGFADFSLLEKDEFKNSPPWFEAFVFKEFSYTKRGIIRVIGESRRQLIRPAYTEVKEKVVSVYSGTPEGDFKPVEEVRKYEVNHAATYERSYGEYFYFEIENSKEMMAEPWLNWSLIKVDGINNLAQWRSENTSQVIETKLIPRQKNEVFFQENNFEKGQKLLGELNDVLSAGLPKDWIIDPYYSKYRLTVNLSSQVLDVEKHGPYKLGVIDATKIRRFVGRSVRGGDDFNTLGIKYKAPMAKDFNAKMKKMAHLVSPLFKKLLESKPMQLTPVEYYNLALKTYGDPYTALAAIVWMGQIESVIHINRTKQGITGFKHKPILMVKDLLGAYYHYWGYFLRGLYEYESTWGSLFGTSRLDMLSGSLECFGMGDFEYIDEGDCAADKMGLETAQMFRKAIYSDSYCD